MRMKDLININAISWNEETHWVNNLEEAGTIKKEGSAQITKLQQIKNLERQIETLKLDYIENDKKILKLALTEWTEKEIINAKLKASNFGRNI